MRESVRPENSSSSLTVQNAFRRGPSAGMGKPVEKPRDGRGTLRRLFSYFLPEIVPVLLLALCAAAGVAAAVIAPGLQSSAVNTLVDRSFEKLPRLLAGMLLAYGISGAAVLLQGFLSASLSRKVIKRLRDDLFRRIVRLPVSYIDAHSHGDIMSRMTNDAENVSNVISQSLGSLFSGVLTLAGTVIVMLMYSVPLALLSCSTVLITVLTTKILSGLMRRYYLQRASLLGSLNGTVEEMVTDYRTVTAYNLQDEAAAEFDRTSDEMTRAGITAQIIANAMGPLMNMLNNASFVIVAAFGAWFVLRGSITVGVISAFVVYSKQFSRPVNELAQLYGEIQTAIAGAERIFSVLDEQEETDSGTLPMPDPSDPGSGVIEFSHVNFSYTPGHPVIHDFCLRVDAGRKIALVGSTGSGKTTIVNLLMRFYEPDSGQITIGGRDIRTIRMAELRDSIEIVLQDTVLFTDTIRANLKYASPSVSDERMIEAAALSGCDKVAEVLPDGYDTVLASAGAGLSQGQRQLLTIGRAFLSYPQILILDEATSSVDTRTEKSIQDAMVRLMKDRTSLIIAHRLSTILDADIIVAMDKGHIVEQGTHEELLKKKGYYYDLYMTQFAGQKT